MMFFIIFYSIGLGSTPWTVNSEIYPLHLRGAGNSLATTSNWISNFIIASVFLTLIDTNIGKLITFASLALICALCWIFVYYLLPETKGKTFEENVCMLCPHVRKS